MLANEIGNKRQNLLPRSLLCNTPVPLQSISGRIFSGYPGKWSLVERRAHAVYLQNDIRHAYKDRHPEIGFSKKSKNGIFLFNQKSKTIIFWCIYGESDFFLFPAACNLILFSAFLIIVSGNNLLYSGLVII